MTRDELRNALNKLLVDSCDLPSGEVIEMIFGWMAVFVYLGALYMLGLPGTVH